MQLTRDSVPANLIRAWEPGRIRIADRWIAGHVVVMPERIVEDWRVASPADLVLGDLRDALASQPEIVLLGTGPALLWPEADLVAELAASGVGLEIMDTAAACRTFNVLVQERRRVAAALFNPGR
ncbi:MAG TPA: MTH938/NDUFAF3 family protein [Gammaproteobacteria bacterium]|nr:MTH938/NDUFAF3 family protein [Gammaproteobacteria bacterium]